VEGCDYWNKRFDSRYADLVDFGGRRGKVIIEKGPYKAYHMPIFYRAALWVEWYCVGDKAAIEYLLSTVTHIGKKTSQGWGRVIRWEIESWPEDWSVWRGDRLMRGIPVEDVGGKPFRLLYYGIRPSYWQRENQMPLAVP
jgi:CRISPR type IV-associated protein Csf3